MAATADRDKYDASVKALQFELEQFWKRSLFFWGFIGAAFIAFATSDSHPSLQAAIASFGFVCSVVWTLANRGSKFWYEDWETKLKIPRQLGPKRLQCDRNHSAAPNHVPRLAPAYNRLSAHG
jgi:hypothetical protein